MNDYLEYRGYLGTVEYSAEDNLLCGEVVGIMKGLIMYHGQTLDCLKNDFEDAVDHYLSCCDEEGRAPMRPSYGDIVIRIPPELHKKLHVYSQYKSAALDDIIEAAIKSYIVM